MIFRPESQPFDSPFPTSELGLFQIVFVGNCDDITILGVGYVSVIFDSQVQEPHYEAPDGNTVGDDKDT